MDQYHLFFLKHKYQSLFPCSRTCLLHCSPSSTNRSELVKPSKAWIKATSTDDAFWMKVQLTQFRPRGLPWPGWLTFYTSSQLNWQTDSVASLIMLVRIQCQNTKYHEYDEIPAADSLLSADREILYACLGFSLAADCTESSLNTVSQPERH